MPFICRCCNYLHRLQVHIGQEFPGVPVVGTQFLLPRIKVKFPEWGTKIPLATWCGQKKKFTFDCLLSSVNLLLTVTGRDITAP